MSGKFREPIVYKPKVKEFIVSDLEAVEFVLCVSKARYPTMEELIDQRVYRESLFSQSSLYAS